MAAFLITAKFQDQLPSVEKARSILVAALCYDSAIESIDVQDDLLLITLLSDRIAGAYALYVVEQLGGRAVRYKDGTAQTVRHPDFVERPWKSWPIWRRWRWRMFPKTRFPE